jgi:arylformamidase
MPQIDVSMPLFVGMPAFPGDPPFGTETVRAVPRGDAYNLSRLTLGSHAGTHVDPPSHFVPGGASLDQIDLSRLNGPCLVVGVPGSVRTVGAREAAGVIQGVERVLLRTSNSERWQRRLEFFPDYVGLDSSGAEALLERGVRLVGIDSLSIERDATGRFPVHHRLLGAGVLVLEGLLLGEVPPGEYELHCLPLRVRDGDGGPARVILTRP